MKTAEEKRKGVLTMNLDISMKALLEGGVHFGHRTNRWHPKMKSYIFTERNGIHIIDLQQTVQCLQTAYDFIRDTVAEGGTVLFVGTKRQAQEAVQLEAERCGMPFVVERWLPGTLTNWPTIYSRIQELQRLEKMKENGEIDLLVKKEQLMINRKINRLLVHLKGIREMRGLPDAIFIVDVLRENTAVHEANLKNVPIVAMVDTNCDPSNIDYVIPANDDAIRSIKLIVSTIADAVIEGLSMRKEEEVEEMAYQPIGEDEGRQRVLARIQFEEEEDEEALLGAATLQKLADSRREEEPESEAEDEDLLVEDIEESGGDEELSPKKTKKPVKKAENLDEGDDFEDVGDLVDDDEEK